LISIQTESEKQVMYKYTKKEMTIRKFLLDYGKYDTQPVGQRLDTELAYEIGNKLTKAQGIVLSIMLGIDLGQITVHEINGEFEFESIDGGHRKRYIKAFFENKFRINAPDRIDIHGKYFRELSEEMQKYFLDTKLTFVIYSKLSVWDIGYIFRSLNKTTDVNHQEMLNSYGNIPIANKIREIVRPVKGIGNKFHNLFEYSERDGKKKYLYLQFDNKRLRIDEMIARLFYRYYDGGGLGKADDKALEEMYSAEINESDAKKIAGKVERLLNFVNEIAEVRKRILGPGLSQKEFTLFARIWMYMEEEYDSFKVKDIDDFYRAITKAMQPFNLNYDDQPKELKVLSPFDKSKTRGKQFNDTLGEHRDREVILETLMWMLKTVDMKELVILKDPRRLFPRQWRENRLIAQDYKCAVSGESITMETAEGAHIKAHSEGGKTEYKNLAMVSAAHNKAMGTMSVNAYKQLVCV